MITRKKQIWKKSYKAKITGKKKGTRKGRKEEKTNTNERKSGMNIEDEGQEGEEDKGRKER